MKHLIWKHTADYSSLLFTAFVCILYFSQVRPHHLTFLTDLHSGSCGGSSQLDGLCFVGVSVKPPWCLCAKIHRIKHWVEAMSERPPLPPCKCLETIIISRSGTDRHCNEPRVLLHIVRWARTWIPSPQRSVQERDLGPLEEVISACFQLIYRAVHFQFGNNSDIYSVIYILIVGWQIQCQQSPLYYTILYYTNTLGR